MSANSEMYLSFKNVFVDDKNQSCNKIVFNSFEMTKKLERIFHEVNEEYFFYKLRLFFFCQPLLIMNLFKSMSFHSMVF